MLFKTTCDIDVPVEDVFDEIGDFAATEIVLMQHGATVERTDDLPGSGEGMSWHISGKFRGSFRETDIRISDFRRPEAISAVSESETFNSKIDIAFIPLSQKKTRMTFAVEVFPKSLKSRLIVQSAKLAKGTLDKRFEDRIRKLGNYVKSNYKNRTAA